MREVPADRRPRVCHLSSQEVMSRNKYLGKKNFGQQVKYKWQSREEEGEMKLGPELPFIGKR